MKIYRDRYIKLGYFALLMFSTFLFEYFDNAIYDIYLFLDLNEIYTTLSGEVIYILALLHSLILFGL
ncbi:hypothetical protein [Sulfurimonas sp.]